MGKSFYIILLDKVLFGPLFQLKIVSRFPQLIVGGIKVAKQLLKFLIVEQHVFQCSFLFYFGFIMSILICSFFLNLTYIHTNLVLFTLQLSTTYLNLATTTLCIVNNFLKSLFFSQLRRGVSKVFIWLVGCSTVALKLSHIELNSGCSFFLVLYFI